MSRLFETIDNLDEFVKEDEVSTASDNQSEEDSKEANTKKILLQVSKLLEQAQDLLIQADDLITENALNELNDDIEEVSNLIMNYSYPGSDRDSAEDLVRQAREVLDDALDDLGIDHE